MSAKSSSIVTALTTVALAAVGFLAYQASASAPDHTTPDKKPSSTASPAPGKGKDGADRQKAEVPVPADSGEGERVVYALGARRVWLVTADGKVKRTYEVTPSTVSPAPGTYKVSGRTLKLTGSDGVPVEHVVRFAMADGVVVGFSAAVDGSMPDPGATKKTGGIRESRADGTAMWDFALHKTKVVVVK
ncbi:hypothetical protein OEIGOIKO_04638 [Streptomyces chrestomyceticus JCM 4735]|uniref:Secreted protein n=1 Tax=Streptomyces chrestomyceticus JCM 4735 TaxID=1306181 RepID=A0A7U9KY04_9ACTN|nr:hypothetical protein [Streptomyces chrestomyceticus]GCD36857.1 hypothetical protein OEIGOIKO_04638 [Streptomyces chrestomyceticus JCM 4735]